MSRFLETIRIDRGLTCHLDWHQRRVNATLAHFYPDHVHARAAFQLEEILSSCDIPADGVYRCRILYDIDTLEVEFIPYVARPVTTLRLMEIPEGYDYSFKYADRKVIEALYAARGDADDILMTRDGYITDTSIANIAFRKDDRWYTPSMPLLAGTTWKRLIASRILIPRPIHKDDIGMFDAFKVFNVMNYWEDVFPQSLRHKIIEFIRYPL